MRKRRGFTLVEIMIVVAIIALLAAIAIPNLLRARMSANESSVQAALRTLSTAMESWRASNGDFGDANLSELGAATPSYIDPVLADGDKAGYTFTDGTITDTTYEFLAHFKPGAGERNFCISTDGVVRASANNITAGNCTNETATQ